MTENSILVTVKYKGETIMFRCFCLNFLNRPHSYLTAWLGDDRKYHTVVNFKTDVEVLETLSVDMGSYTREDFIENENLMQAVQYIG